MTVIRPALDDEAPEIDGGEPFIGPVYLDRSTEEGYILGEEEVNGLDRD